MTTADTTRTPQQRLIDAAGELTEARRRHVWLEFYDPKQKRRVRRKANAGKSSLVGLLQIDVERDDDTAPKTAGGGLAGGYESRPPGHYAPRELLDALHCDLALWLAWCGLDERGDAQAHIRAFVGIADRLSAQWPDVLAGVVNMLEQWVERLRRYAGLDRIFRPRTPCPQCEVVGTITIWINEDTRRAERAKCGTCRAGWDASTVGVLVEHVRRSSGGRPVVDLTKTTRTTM